MRRLGLTGRLILLLGLAFVSLQGIMTTAYLTERRSAAPTDLWLPYPDQLAAMVALFEQADPAGRDLLLRAFSDGNLLLRIAASAPETAGVAGDLGMPAATARLRSYSQVFKGRAVNVAVAADYADTPFARLRGFMNPGRVRVSVALDDGTWLVLQRQGGGTLTLGGLPVGQVGGFMGTFVAFLVIFAVWREMRPLRQLRSAAAEFGDSLLPRPVPPTGAADLRELILAFNAMQGRIARLDQNRTDMIAAIAHDIRTPLTRLRLRLRGLDPGLQADAERDIEEISRISDEAVRFATAGLATLDQKVDLAQLLRGLARHDAVLVRINAPLGGTAITGNSELMARCFDNLVSNAMHHADRCEVTLTARPGALVVTVDDDGPGIAPGDRMRLLQPFERGEASRNRATGGTGLGLALADRIVRRHGGQLHLEQADLGGLRVRLVFASV
ncbi:ATP-binding protein [Actibacterium sp. D379-3]